jgi:hypothetical protein
MSPLAFFLAGSIAFSIPVAAQGDPIAEVAKRKVTQAPLPTQPSDHVIIPGGRIGSLRLSGNINDIQKEFGPPTKTIDGPWRFSKTSWWRGLYVEFDPGTENIFLIGIGASGTSPWDSKISASPWADYSISNGIRFGSTRDGVVSAFGSPERTVTAGGSTSLYYDKKGIRFTVLDVGPETGKVGEIRIVWPTVLRGDSLIIPGQRISNVDVGMPLERALKLLGGGYFRGENAPGYNVYYWPHLGLSFVESSGNAISVRAARDLPSDAMGIRYATADKLGLGSSSLEVKAVFGEASRTEPLSGGLLSLIYDSRGISFSLDSRQLIIAVDVFAKVPSGSAADHYNRAASHLQKGELEPAIVELTKAIELDPKNAETYNARADTFLRVGKPMQGLPDVEKSLELRPDDPNTLDTRGHIFEALGRRVEAIADYRRALAKMPGLQESRDGLKRLGATP